jgi:hypothetical protein
MGSCCKKKNKLPTTTSKDHEKKPTNSIANSMATDKSDSMDRNEENLME